MKRISLIIILLLGLIRLEMPLMQGPGMPGTPMHFLTQIPWQPAQNSSAPIERDRAASVAQVRVASDTRIRIIRPVGVSIAIVPRPTWLRPAIPPLPPRPDTTPPGTRAPPSPLVTRFG